MLSHGSTLFFHSRLSPVLYADTRSCSSQSTREWSSPHFPRGGFQPRPPLSFGFLAVTLSVIVFTLLIYHTFLRLSTPVSNFDLSVGLKWLRIYKIYNYNLVGTGVLDCPQRRIFMFLNWYNPFAIRVCALCLTNQTVNVFGQSRTPVPTVLEKSRLVANSHNTPINPNLFFHLFSYKTKKDGGSVFLWSHR